MKDKPIEKALGQLSLKDKVMETELKISCWSVENNISFNAAGSLVSTVKEIDPEVVENCSNKP
jgi:hypothetical protein